MATYEEECKKKSSLKMERMLFFNPPPHLLPRLRLQSPCPRVHCSLKPCGFFRVRPGSPAKANLYARTIQLNLFCTNAVLFYK